MFVTEKKRLMKPSVVWRNYNLGRWTTGENLFQESVTAFSVETWHTCTKHSPIP